MALYMVTNQHQPGSCGAVSADFVKWVDGKPAEFVASHCSCGVGDHTVYTLVETAGPAEAMQAIPADLAGLASRVVRVEESYGMAHGMMQH